MHYRTADAPAIVHARENSIRQHITEFSLTETERNITHASFVFVEGIISQAEAFVNSFVPIIGDKRCLSQKAFLLSH